ncbi:MAG: hypothetical protein GF331_13900 [Chitinivibrionales bacterium]|nr:hypothetical protein [Chitinivibrionales bacterium]
MVTLQDDERIQVEDDLERSAALLNEAWPIPRWEYTPEMLAAYLHRPSWIPSVALGYFRGDELGGLFCAFPYRLQLNGRRLKASYGTWWTAKSKFVLRRVGTKILGVAQFLAHVYAVDAAVAVTRAGTVSDKANLAVFAQLDMPSTLLKTYGELMSTPRLLAARLSSAGHTGEVRRADSSAAADIATLVTAPPPPSCLYREFAESEIPFVFVERPHTHTWLYLRGGRPKALLNVLIKGYRGASLVRNAYVEHLVGDGMTQAECASFLRDVLTDPVWDTVHAISVIDNGYFPTEHLRACGFFPTSERFNLYGIPYNPDVVLEPVESFNLEVY